MWLAALARGNDDNAGPPQERRQFVYQSSVVVNKENMRPRGPRPCCAERLSRHRRARVSCTALRWKRRGIVLRRGRAVPQRPESRLHIEVGEPGIPAPTFFELGTESCCCVLAYLRWRPSRSCLCRQRPEQTAIRSPARSQTRHVHGDGTCCRHTEQPFVSIDTRASSEPALRREKEGRGYS
jgi:hypothetical protein